MAKWVDRWYVPSNSNPDKEYTVSRADDGETWGCGCKAWTLNRHRIKDGICSHIRKVKKAIVEETWTIEPIRQDEFFTEEEFAL
jgi:hypothetical protein